MAQHLKLSACDFIVVAAIVKFIVFCQYAAHPGTHMTVTLYGILHGFVALYCKIGIIALEVRRIYFHCAKGILKTFYEILIALRIACDILAVARL